MTTSYFIGKKVAEIERWYYLYLLLIHKAKLLEQDKGDFHRDLD